MLTPIILFAEVCALTLKAFDLFKMTDLGGQKRDLCAYCFETVV